MKIIFDNAKFVDKYYVKKVYKRAIEYLNQPNELEVNVNFVNKEEIRQLNNDFRKVDKATDVLSFPLLELVENTVIDISQHLVDFDYSTKRLPLGDIFICREIAKEQAVEYGHSEKREIAFLALHGLLHLLGYDHIEDNQRQLMEETQRQIMLIANINREEK